MEHQKLWIRWRRINVPLPSLGQPPVLTNALVNSTAAAGASSMTSTLGTSFLMLPRPFFSAGSLGPLSSFQPYGLLPYGLYRRPRTGVTHL
jgi:hypothetical protein